MDRPFFVSANRPDAATALTGFENHLYKEGPMSSEETVMQLPLSELYAALEDISPHNYTLFSAARDIYADASGVMLGTSPTGKSRTLWPSASSPTLF